MRRIGSRMLLRLALVAASLAWATAAFTHTIGDPVRGERIATAVLADADARAEITAPIAATVMATTGIPPERSAIVEATVDQVLRDPAGARAYVDPFAGSWARLLGEDDPRPAQFDLQPILDDLDDRLAAAGIASDLELVGSGGQFAVPDVPLPRNQLDWMDGARRGVAASVLPLSLIAIGLAGTAFVVGDRRHVLRHVGIWGVLAGGLWVAGPPLLVWAARSWAPGFDAVAAVAIDAATAALRFPALVMVVGGAGLIVGSFALPPAATSRPSTATARPVHRPTPAARPARPPGAAGSAPRGASTEPMPTVDVPDRSPTPSTPPAPSAAATPSSPEELDGDALWDHYR